MPNLTSDDKNVLITAGKYICKSAVIIAKETFSLGYKIGTYVKNKFNKKA